MPTRRRGTIVALSAVAVAVVVGACQASSGSTAPTYKPAPCPNPIVAGAAQFDLGAGFDCGYLMVTENRERPSARTTRIPVARLRAQSPNPKPDPIVFLAGGPGGSGLLQQSAALGWNADRDVIFISQRGTLKTDPFLSCPEIDEFTARSAHPVMTDPATSAASAAATSGCRNRNAREGWDLSAYNTTENAADVADLRTALGIDEWNVYGVSNGTNLALQLLRDHLEGIRAMVLDGVVPPQTRSVEVDGLARRPDTRRCSMPALASPSATALFRACDEFTRLVSDLTERATSLGFEGHIAWAEAMP